MMRVILLLRGSRKVDSWKKIDVSPNREYDFYVIIKDATFEFFP